MSTATAALGFSVHTGWAGAVAVAGPLASPKLMHRSRVDLSPGKESAHVFHVAAEKRTGAAARHIEGCGKAVADSARLGLASLAKALAISPVTVGVVVANAPLPGSLEAILRSHMLIHAAEGDFYRRAVLQAGEGLGWRPIAVPSKELAPAAAAALAIAPERVKDWLVAFGREVGRPWGRDEKDAFLAACVALAQCRRAPRRA
jgi:hypothetical protein